ncbi:hypothetical protein [Mangrovibacillus cuniculi]|uniref:DUF4234 domain-containing protein n=1 Tax=Mangrovibacillus cuniculi TaxID=2593652 RepID=A0A7S8CE31_9BACI|nr:hypothetical protein [Mangrovibacillus cuniculi]QPC48280.1 hypothetical protein G8O30_15815 [Mangrovibacillus cuniculi]
MNKTVQLQDFKKVPLLLTLLLSFITFGVYMAYWFIRERKNFTNQEGIRVISIKLWWAFLLFLIVSFFHSLIGTFLFTPYGLAITESVDVILSAYFLGLLYYSVFRIRDIVEDTHQEKIFKPWLLVLFHIWYVQYKVNQAHRQPLHQKHR